MILDFATERLLSAHWGAQIADPAGRPDLEKALADILTPDILAHLPPSLQLENPHAQIAGWIAARAAESDVMTVRAKADDALLGLIILAKPGGTEGLPTLHLGYLIARHAWGQGIATELLSGLVAAARQAGPLRLVGGVAPDNPASARVLEKAGFLRDSRQSTPQSDIYRLDVR